VRNNIAYGQPEVKDAVVEKAARNALAHDFILQMPQGMTRSSAKKDSGFPAASGSDWPLLALSLKDARF